MPLPVDLVVGMGGWLHPMGLCVYFVIYVQYSMMVKVISVSISGLILGLRRANERRRYFVTTSLIGWVQA